MRKLWIALLSSVFVLGMAAGASATTEETPAYEDDKKISITKHFVNKNGGVSPAETFEFSTFTEVSIQENAAAQWPETLPTISSISYAEGDATADGTGNGAKTVDIVLPTYTAVGVYTYSFREVVPTTKTAGVTYHTDPLYLVVTVVEDTDGQKRVAAVHCEGSANAGTYGTPPKTDIFDNSYESGTLAVSKTVTGNMGDKSKYFDVTVTFQAPEGEVIKSTIKYSGGKYQNEYTVENNTATIQVKDGDTVTFTNLPEGVTWTVEEANYTGEGYDAAVYSTKTGSIEAGNDDSCTITNNKEVNVDTGISLDVRPYILIIGFAAAAGILLVLRRRFSNREV